MNLIAVSLAKKERLLKDIRILPIFQSAASLGIFPGFFHPQSLNETQSPRNAEKSFGENISRLLEKENAV